MKRILPAAFLALALVTFAAAQQADTTQTAAPPPTHGTPQADMAAPAPKPARSSQEEKEAYARTYTRCIRAPMPCTEPRRPIPTEPPQNEPR